MKQIPLLIEVIMIQVFNVFCVMRLFGDADGAAVGYVKSVIDPEERRLLNPGGRQYGEVSTA